MLSEPRRRNLERLLRPKSIAVVGGRVAEEVIRQSRRLGFAGRIFAVHPRRTALADVPCVPRIEDLPEPPDAVFLGVNREATVEAARRLRELGAGGIVAYASGFAEASDGALLQRQLIEEAGDMALLGPNCYGMLNLLDRVALWPDSHGARPVERGVALITQSGNIGITLTLQERSLPIACVLSVGNQAQLAVHHYLDALADDPGITAIGLYLEEIAEPAAFALAVGRCAARRVPVVAIKAGRSDAGARATLSHTSSLAGQDRVVDAFLRRHGVARVDSLADLLETLKLLHVQGPLPGRRIGSLGCSGGDAAMVADLAAAADLELPPLPEPARRHLAGVLGPGVALANPLDYHTAIWGDRERLTRCFAAMQGAGFDVTLLVLDHPRPDAHDARAWDAAAGAMADAARTTGARAIVVSSLPETMPPEVRERLMTARVAPMQGLPECMRAVARAAWIGAAWRRSGRSPPGARAVAPPLRDGALLREDDAKRVLARHGIAVPEGEVVPLAEAVAAARRIGFPVTLKTAAGLARRTEAGGVILDLRTARQVAAAAARLARLGDLVLVERMLPRPVAELIVGIETDPHFGPHLVLGAGGIMAELWRDTGLLLLPAEPADVLEALRALRIWPVLEGFRNAPAADVDAIVRIVCRVGALALAQEIAALEINPLMVYGDGAIAADALVRTQAPVAAAVEQVA